MPSKQQSLILGGLVVGLLSTSYLGFLNILCCAGVIGGAMVAVWHYTSTNELTMTGGQGAAMGAFAALIGYAIAFVLNFILMSAGIRHDLMMAEWSMANFADSMQPEQLDAIEEQLNTPFSMGYYLKSTILGWGALGLPVSAAFGAIGGAIGAAVFKKGSEDEA